jgi:hypothetical protein
MFDETVFMNPTVDQIMARAKKIEADIRTYLLTERTKTETYKGYVISWQEPPITTAKWTANVGPDGIQGSKVIDGQTCEEMITKAKAYIDSLGV